MRLHEALPKAGSRKRPRRFGRGIAAGQGASCGKGMRGQNSRAGSSTRPGFEGGQNPLYRRLPKLKHFPIVNQMCFTIINVEQLNDLPANSQVNLFSLMESGIITTNDGPLKVLGNGELTVALQVEAAAFSQSAQAKIEAAGGSFALLNHP